MPIAGLLNNKGFNAGETARIGAAFDVAWEVVKNRNLDLGDGALTTAAREVLAKIVIEEAQRGVTGGNLVQRSLTRFSQAGGAASG